jgi:hypothetical protein
VRDVAILAQLPRNVERFGAPVGTMGSQIYENSMVESAAPSDHGSSNPARSSSSIPVGSVAETSVASNGHLPNQYAHPTDPADYDPMLAPLPPPFEIFNVPEAGMALDEISWFGTTSLPTQEAATARHQRAIIRSTSARPIPSNGRLPRRQTHPTGDSAEEPICID